MWTLPLANFFTDHWRDGIEILILALVIYTIYRQFRQTLGFQILTGLVIILVALMFISDGLKLEVIKKIVGTVTQYLGFAIVVIFQPELRKALAKFGTIFGEDVKTKEFLDELIEAVEQLSRKNFGALFALERNVDLEEFRNSGVEIDSKFSTDLCMTLFHPKTTLHDGGVIIQEDRILAAGCVFPVSQRESSDRSVGLRHRAGIGITEDSDAIAIIVSEETGHIGISYKGELEAHLHQDEFKRRLYELYQVDLEEGD